MKKIVILSSILALLLSGCGAKTTFENDFIVVEFPAKIETRLSSSAINITPVKEDTFEPVEIKISTLVGEEDSLHRADLISMHNELVENACLNGETCKRILSREATTIHDQPAIKFTLEADNPNPTEEDSAVIKSSSYWTSYKGNLIVISGSSGFDNPKLEGDTFDEIVQKIVLK